MNVDPASGQPVCTVTVLGSSPERWFAGRVISLQDRWITVQAAADLPREGVFKISWAKYIALAEVVSAQKSDGNLILRIRHFLQLDDIDEMRRRWM